jgi:hypothetical protein
MARLIQITCPGCNTTLKVNCGIQDMVEVSCPKCSKRLAARVPSATAAVPLAKPAAEIDPAFWDAPAPRPVSPPPRPAPRPPARPVMRSNKAKRNSHGGLKIALAAVGVLLLLPVGWGIFVAIRAVSQGGLAELASISFLPDTHEKLIADFFEVQERQMLKFLDAEKIDQAYVDDLKASAAAQQRTAERLLLRAVKLDAASRKQHEAFTQQSKELNDRYQDRARERSLSLTPVEQQCL